MGQGLSLIPGARETALERERRGLWGRRVVLAALIAYLALGLFGVFGDRDGTVSASASGWELEVVHPEASRSGLSIDWQITVRRRGGFDAPIAIATTGDFVELLDENAVEPSPSSSTTDRGRLIWVFDPPQGDTLVVRFDGRIDPSRRGKASATTSVLDDGRPLVSVDYDTRVFP